MSHAHLDLALTEQCAPRRVGDHRGLTHEPPQGLNLDEDTLEDYLGNNLARMVGIEPTARPKTVEEAKQRLADAKAGAAIGAARDSAKVAA